MRDVVELVRIGAGCEPEIRRDGRGWRSDLLERVAGSLEAGVGDRIDRDSRRVTVSVATEITVTRPDLASSAPSNFTVRRAARGTALRTPSPANRRSVPTLVIAMPRGSIPTSEMFVMTSSSSCRSPRRCSSANSVT